MKPDQVDVIARTMLRYLEQIDHAQETGFKRQLMSDIVQRDLLDGIDLNFTVLHAVTVAHLDLRTHPDANAAGDGPAPYTLPKTLRENHGEKVVTASPQGWNSARERVASRPQLSHRLAFSCRRFQPLSHPCFA